MCRAPRICAPAMWWRAKLKNNSLGNCSLLSGGSNLSQGDLFEGPLLVFLVGLAGRRPLTSLFQFRRRFPFDFLQPRLDARGAIEIVFLGHIERLVEMVDGGLELAARIGELGEGLL